MYKLLSSLDGFGHKQKLQIHSHNPVQKSIFGGILTMIIYGSSMAYFLLEFVDWAKNNKLPKITTYRKSIDQSETLQLPSRIFEISYYYWENSDIDPFDPSNLIFYPIVSKIIGEMNNETILPIQFEQTSYENGKTKNTFYLENLTIVGSPSNSETSGDFIDYQVAISMCNQSKIPENFKCGDNDKIKQFFQQVNYFTILYFNYGYDSKKKELLKLPKYELLDIYLDTSQFYQFTLKLSNTETDDGILFNNKHQFSYIADFTPSLFVYSQEKAVTTYGVITPLVLYFTLDSIKEEVFIEYPKISEILADTGSIISWIILISVIVIKYNEKTSSEKAIQDVIKLYYPDYTDLIVNFSLFGKCLSANIKNKKYDPDKISKIIKKLKQIAKHKINYISLQYEISRLQQAIIQFMGIESLKIEVKENKFETLLDNLGYLIVDPSDNMNIVKYNITQQPQQINYDQTIQLEGFENSNIFQICDQQMIESTLGLYQMPIFGLKQNNNLQIEKSIFPSEELRIEDISKQDSKS